MTNLKKELYWFLVYSSLTLNLSCFLKIVHIYNYWLYYLFYMVMIYLSIKMCKFWLHFFLLKQTIINRILILTIILIMANLVAEYFLPGIKFVSVVKLVGDAKLNSIILILVFSLISASLYELIYHLQKK